MQKHTKMLPLQHVSLTGIPDSDPSFTAEVEKIGGTEAHICFQCGTCTGILPVRHPQQLPFRNFMRRVNLGINRAAVLRASLAVYETCSCDQSEHFHRPNELHALRCTV